MINFIAQHKGLVASFAGAAFVIAMIGGASTEVGPWYESLRFPSWRPPNWLFGPAWTLIYIFTVASAVIAWDRAPDAADHEWLLLLFAINAMLNIAWSPLFFKLRRPDWALIEVAFLWLSILALVHATFSIAPLAGWLMTPYFAWVTFASYLNFTMVRLNRPFAATTGEARR